MGRQSPIARHVPEEGNLEVAYPAADFETRQLRPHHQ